MRQEILAHIKENSSCILEFKNGVQLRSCNGNTFILQEFKNSNGWTVYTPTPNNVDKTMELLHQTTGMPLPENSF